jgi:hypothetical protein
MQTLTEPCNREHANPNCSGNSHYSVKYLTTTPLYRKKTKEIPNDKLLRV